jgi:hypothetical protein
MQNLRRILQGLRRRMPEGRRLASDRAEARHIQMPRSLQLIKVALCMAHRISKEDRGAPGSRALRISLVTNI